jgi:hypothetical protein
MTSVVISFAFCNFLNLGRYTYMDTTTDIKILVQNDYKGQPNWITTCIIDCMKFWNNTGIAELQITREEEPDEHTKAFDDEILDKMLIDCNTYVNCDIAQGGHHGVFECGRTRSHIWVHRNGKRIFMFHTNVPV